MIRKVLVSSCLLGRNVRYDGSYKLAEHPVLDRWQSEGRIVSICPELTVGFPTPRPSAELTTGSGEDVLRGKGSVLEQTGRDVTSLYIDGAAAALELALSHGCKYAVLTDGSPSCGSSFVYDGSFQGNTISGNGVTASFLKQAGIAVFSQKQIEELDLILRENEAQERADDTFSGSPDLEVRA
ncbi:uncharacterized protein YbbK (DUF523 family) [Rhizobium sp. BK529]|uniref:DUF523 domain-containing protein n=1 Tax=unclassified Rhizobium TaxID=2613769 RepID=UPI001048CE5C|nr:MULTISPECIES: DUF523 domain-containing protein [unclassified Rhizobium]MBB3595000.1 uncharacterized protein YbbK (DUF523 family) [Rhizobium sp. BK529]TCR98740.1 uncharacterized protein YbbK (DUF523 family) [Rhizobium sp. BK418]